MDVVKLASPFGDHMVLQHGVPAPLWGTGEPGMPATAELCGQTLTTRADERGAWRVTFAPLTPGGPFTLRVRGSSTVVVRDVLIGDVWLCSGQSNMEWPLLQSDGADDELRRADIPGLRLVTVPKIPADTPQRDAAMSWSVCSASSAKLFSAVAFHFGKRLHQELDIPIGLINCSWGGSCAEAWMPLDVLERDPRHRQLLSFVSLCPCAPRPPARPYHVKKVTLRDGLWCGLWNSVTITLWLRHEAYYAERVSSFMCAQYSRSNIAGR